MMHNAIDHNLQQEHLKKDHTFWQKTIAERCNKMLPSNLYSFFQSTNLIWQAAFNECLYSV